MNREQVTAMDRAVMRARRYAAAMGALEHLQLEYEVSPTPANLRRVQREEARIKRAFE